MPRSSWLLVILAGVALTATGCAHCGKCSRLPLPCPSGDCGVGMVGAPVMAGPVMMAPTMVTVPEAPTMIQSQPAGSGSGAGAGSNKPGGAGSSSMPSPLPPSPGVQSPPFSPGPATSN